MKQILSTRSQAQDQLVYSDERLQMIADAADIDTDRIMERRADFEGAALWARLQNRKNNIPPSTIKKKLQSIQTHSNKLIGLLEDPNVAEITEFTSVIISLQDLADAANAAHNGYARPDKRDIEGGWLFDMASIYQEVSGRKATISIDPMTEKPTGRFLRFLESAMPPTGLNLSPNALRERWRDIVPKPKLRSKPPQKNRK